MRAATRRPASIPPGLSGQDVGCAGKVTNAVNFVNATYSTPREHALVGSRLYMPAEHLADEQVRTQMGIPASPTFRTKPELGLELLAQHVVAGIAIPWCTEVGLGYVNGKRRRKTATRNSHRERAARLVEMRPAGKRKALVARTPTVDKWFRAFEDLLVRAMIAGTR